MLERHNFRQLLSFLYKTKHDFINLQSQLMSNYRGRLNNLKMHKK